MKSNIIPIIATIVSLGTKPALAQENLEKCMNEAIERSTLDIYESFAIEGNVVRINLEREEGSYMQVPSFRYSETGIILPNMQTMGFAIAENIYNKGNICDRNITNAGFSSCCEEKPEIQIEYQTPPQTQNRWYNYDASEITSFHEKMQTLIDEELFDGTISPNELNKMHCKPLGIECSRKYVGEGNYLYTVSKANPNIEANFSVVYENKPIE